MRRLLTADDLDDDVDLGVVQDGSGVSGQEGAVQGDGALLAEIAHQYARQLQGAAQLPSVSFRFLGQDLGDAAAHYP